MRKLLRRHIIGANRVFRLAREGRDARLAGLDRRYALGDAAREVGQGVDADAVLSGKAAQREQPLLDVLQLPRIEIGGVQRRFERLLGEPERVERAGERAQRRVEQLASLRRAALQPARRLRQRPDDGMIALENAERVAQIDRDLFRPLHRQPPLGEALFLARFRREFRQLGVGVAQIVGVGPGLGEALLLVLERPPRRLHRAMQRAQRLHLARQPAMRVDQLPMRGGIDHRALVVLAVNLDQFLADGAQGLGADRRVVDEGAGAPVRCLGAAQDQFAVRGDPEFARLEVGGMIGARLE